MSDQPTLAPATRSTPRSVLVSAWSVPIMVLGQFSMLAIVPVVLVLVGTIRRPSLRALRPYGVVLAAVYATPLVIWILRPDRAQSLSKDMHPAFMALIVAAAAALLVKLYTRKS
ncbi:hypothetical protein [Pengzhenrongella sicca]|uniref:Transmembrane protein n=1 Tax=Pengzhenrongella sicca TaxID=2819238 RepID=A0A8A4ZAV1_9MICO|nr:hypothetical protein [Pengzhenrongella sicca]QTE29004.1 hypothetical protein J4E96_17095 [Pengzhenrongella sicca]